MQVWHPDRFSGEMRERAEAQAQEFSAKSGATIRAGSNAEAAQGAEVVVLSVPYAAHAATLQELAPVLQGKVVLDLTVPLQPPIAMTAVSVLRM